jgi:hypothetical protein
MVSRVTSVIDRLGLGDSVRLVEQLDHPEAFYAACDVVVAPFESVRFSSVNLVEAMAYGRPHIVTDIGEPAELVDRYQGGIKVPVNDVAKLADAMVALATDPARVRQLGQRAREGAADLTVDAVARRLSGVYEGLVATRRPKRAAGRGRAFLTGGDRHAPLRKTSLQRFPARARVPAGACGYSQRAPRYHSSVRRVPCSRSTFGLNPSSRCALAVEKARFFTKKSSRRGKSGGSMPNGLHSRSQSTAATITGATGMWPRGAGTSATRRDRIDELADRRVPRNRRTH